MTGSTKTLKLNPEARTFKSECNHCHDVHVRVGGADVRVCVCVVVVFVFSDGQVHANVQSGSGFMF